MGANNFLNKATLEQGIKKTLVFVVVLFFYAAGVCQQGSVEQIQIVGLEKNKESFLRKFILLKEGATLDSICLQKDIEQLKRLVSVSNATYEVSKTANQEAYNVTYIIQENLTLIPGISIWTSGNGEFAIRGGLTEFNFLGQGIAIGGYYQRDIFDSYGLNFRAPYLFGKHFGVALNFQDLNSQEPVFFESGTAAYKYRNKGYEIMALAQVNFQNRFELGVNYFIEEYDYLMGTLPPAGIPFNLKVHKLSYKLIYEHNQLKYNFYKLRGFKSTLNLQYVQGANEALPSFLIGWNDFLYFKEVGAKGNWANRLRIGSATNDETPFAPFALDNNINIRGVGNIIDRGTASIVLNTEYRHTLYERNWFVLQSNAFVDAGTWREPGGVYDDLFKSDNFRIYTGLGLRFMHKKIYNATFRLDYGVGVSKDASQGLVFGIGQYF